jgi:hypothetical protein
MIRSRQRLWDRWTLLAPAPFRAAESGQADPSIGRALVELALLVGILLVVLILALVGPLR